VRFKISNRDLEQWWRRVWGSLEVSFVGLDVLRHESFDRIAPIVHLTEEGLPRGNPGYTVVARSAWC
jgi:hypothetical protein